MIHPQQFLAVTIAAAVAKQAVPTGFSGLSQEGVEAMIAAPRSVDGDRRVRRNLSRRVDRLLRRASIRGLRGTILRITPPVALRRGDKPTQSRLETRP
jgi:hypothetical protein